MREGEEPRPRVQSLIRSVRTASSSGGFVEIVGFDDLLYRLYKQCQVRDEQIESGLRFVGLRRQFMPKHIKSRSPPPGPYLTLKNPSKTAFPEPSWTAVGSVLCRLCYLRTGGFRSYSTNLLDPDGRSMRSVIFLTSGAIMGCPSASNIEKITR